MSSSQDFPLSYGQRALWFLARLQPKSTAYNVSLAARTRGVDPALLRQAWQLLAQRHEPLRTTYPAVAGQPVARVHAALPVDFAEIDGPDLSTEGMRERLAAEAALPFDLERGPVLRLRLLAGERGGGEQGLLVCLHHVGIDFASLALLLEEFGAVYTALAAGEEPSLPPAAPPYREFAREQGERLAGASGEEMLAFWRQSLAGAPPSLQLPTDRPRPPFPSFRGAIHSAEIGPALTRRLKERAAELGVELPTLVLAAFQALLHRVSGQQDVVVGMPVPGRPDERFADTVGYFINTVAVRADFAGSPPFARFAARQQERLEAIRPVSDYPFPLLVERLKPAREGGQSPFFPVFFVLYQGSEERVARVLTGEGGRPIELGALSLEPLPLSNQGAMFDLSLLMSDAGETLSAAFQYATDLFEAESVARFAGDFESLLEAVAENPECPVSDLPATLGAARIWQTREAAPTRPAADLSAVRDRAESRRALLERNRRGRTG